MHNVLAYILIFAVLSVAYKILDKLLAVFIHNYQRYKLCMWTFICSLRDDDTTLPVICSRHTHELNNDN